MIEAFNLTEDGDKIGTGHTKPFTIRFWMPPPDLPFSVPEDASPDITDIPDDFTSLLGELTDQYWKINVGDDGATDPEISVDSGSASSFLDVTTNSDSIELSLNSENARPGVYLIKIKATDDAGNSKAEIFTIIINDENFINE